MMSVVASVNLVSNVKDTEKILSSETDNININWS